MGKISEELQRILQAKSDIKDAIEQKGVSVGDIKLDAYADKIKLIQGGGSSEDEEEYIPDDYTYFSFYYAQTTYTLNIKIRPEVADAVTIDWGDGNIEKTTSTDLTGYTHSYSQIKGYSVKLYADPKVTYILEGTGTTYLNIAITYMHIDLYDFTPAKNCKVGNYFMLGSTSTFRKDSSLKIPILNTNIPFYYAAGTLSKKIKIPNNIVRLENYGLSYAFAVKQIIIPEQVTYVGSYCFRYDRMLEEVIWLSSQTFIQNYCFGDCYTLKVLDLGNATLIFRFGASNTSTTKGGTTYIHIHDDLKIIVPKNLYNSWKSSTYWSTFINYIYWRDTDGTLKNTAV